jgi:TetR/AcrR family transcriptional regulator, multidrug resistance operon repressor
MRSKDNSKEIVILKTALAMINIEGLSGLKMSDLAKQAGLATGTLYIYFQNKEAIIKRLFTYIVEQVSLDVMRGVTPDITLKEKIRYVCLNYLYELIAYPDYKVFVEQFLRSPYSKQEDKEMLAISTYLEPVIHLIKGGSEQGILKETDPFVLIELSRGGLENYAQQLINTETELTDAGFEMVFEFIWDGISKYQRS